MCLAPTYPRVKGSLSECGSEYDPESDLATRGGIAWTATLWDNLLSRNVLDLGKQYPGGPSGLRHRRQRFASGLTIDLSGSSLLELGPNFTPYKPHLVKGATHVVCRQRIYGSLP